MYSDTYADKDSRQLIYIAYNMHWESYSLALPKVEGKNGFKVIAMSDDDKQSVYIDDKKRKVIIPKRSMAVLTAGYQNRKNTQASVAIESDDNSGTRSKKHSKNKKSADNERAIGFHGLQ